MRRPTHRRPGPAARASAAVAALALLLAACTATSPSPSPSPSPDESPDPELGFRLRATMVQALPPEAVFTWMPTTLITDDLIALQQGAIPLIFPGPLVTPLIGVQLTEGAWTRIVDEARAAGILEGETDFTGGAMPPGAESGRLELVVDGRLVELTGDPSRVSFCGDTYCQAEPGTPEAFATFFGLLGNLPGWIGEGVGPPADWAPDGYAVIVGPPPPDDQGLAVAPVPWPFETPSATFGKSLTGDAARRCGIITGAEAAAFTPILGRANQLTTWRDPAAANPLGLTVRPLLPGDGDPCAGLVGG
ncbi:MAG TPA: hypothetical protein VFX65_01390 [Candidatus Limnocylindrales bacterium]|nr:hypothetical protein [Candidatus Limnocylindrales bacterium]